MLRPASPLAGFWMGGYEGADHVNGSGQALDMAQASGHVDRLDEDHRRAAQAGLSCVRESIGWRLAESAGGAIDLSRALQIQASAARHGLQPLWTLMHYGVPADLSLHDDAMVPRLVRFAREVARVLRRGSERPPVYNVVNEISFLAWAASHSDLLHSQGDGAAASTGYEIKRRLARAALLAMRAMRHEDPRARFMNVEPLVHVVAPVDQPELQAQAALESSWQWQAWDMLAGRLEPELGGGPQWLDLVGVNHYHQGQWEVASGNRLHWHLRDPRRRPLHRLLHDTWQRYPGPLVVAETSHVGIGRAPWLHEVAAEVRTALRQGVPVQGVCLYPLVDRPDWQEPARWHRSGLWHVDSARSHAAAAMAVRPKRRHARAMQRHAEPDVHAALRAWQQHLPHARGAAATSAHPLPALVAYTECKSHALEGADVALLQRLARQHAEQRVVLVLLAGEATALATGPSLDHRSCGPMLDVLEPRGLGGLDASNRYRQLSAALAAWLSAQGLDVHFAWIDSPAALPLALALKPLQVCHGSAPGTQGLHCSDIWQGNVEPIFFRRAAASAGSWAHLETDALLHEHRSPGTGSDPTAVQRPIVGYAGPIDARLDLALLAQLAAARPAWHWMLIGPVRGIDAASLPRAPNLHWVGEQPQALLPAWMARWQMGFVPRIPVAPEEDELPSAIAEALAAGLAVVTSLPVARSASARRPAGLLQAEAAAESFILACERGLAEPPALRRQRRLGAWHGWRASQRQGIRP